MSDDCFCIYPLLQSTNFYADKRLNQHERNLGEIVWCMPREMFKYARRVVDENSRPIFERSITDRMVMTLNGYPVYLIPAISPMDATGDLIAAVGAPKHYVIFTNTADMVFQVNPYAEMKEGMTQFIIYATADGQLDSHTTGTAEATTWATMINGTIS